MAKYYHIQNILRSFLFASLILATAKANMLAAQPSNNTVQQQAQGAEPLLVKEYLLDGKGIINVFTASGNINMVSVPDTRKVRIELYADQGFSFWPFSNSLDNYRITSLKRGNEISTSVELKSKRKPSFWCNETTFSYKIMVPESISTNLKTLAGNISMQNVHGDHLLRSSLGNITASDVGGTIKAKSSGGNITINNSRGIIYAWADLGNINTSNTSGELRLKIQGGKISSSEISGSMVAVVNAGDIYAQFKQIDEVINLQTNAGNIFLAVPNSKGYDLYSTGSSIQFDQTGIFKGTYSSSLVDGSINGGGIPINLTANAGTVTVELKK